MVELCSRWRSVSVFDPRRERGILVHSCSRFRFRSRSRSISVFGPHRERDGCRGGGETGAGAIAVAEQNGKTR